MEFNKYLKTLMTEDEDRYGEEGTDFASPDGRKGAAFGALQNQMNEFTGDLPQIPMRPDDQMEEPVVQEQINDIVEADNAPSEGPVDEVVEQAITQTASAPSRDIASVEEPTLSPQEQLLKEFRDYKAQREGSVKEARSKDADIELLENMNKAFQQIGTGLGAGYANVKMNPIDLNASNLGSQERQSQQDKLNEMLQEYKILSKGERSELDNIKLETAKEKLSQLKNKPLKANSNRPAAFEKKFQEKQAEKFIEAQDKAKMAQEDDNKIDDALGSFLDYSKSSLAGTGPLATVGGLSKYGSEDLQNIDAKFKDLSLSKMTKMFAGMSKAVDSDAERRAFEATAPSITNDDETNAQILLGAKAVNLRNKLEAKYQRQYLDQNGSMDGYESPIMDKPTSVIVDPSNGRLRIIPREQLQKAKDNQFLELDDYAKTLLEE